MTTPSDPKEPPDEPVDATVESPAAVARETRGQAAGGGVPPGGAGRQSVRHPVLRAWALAVSADVVQWVFMPLFAPGFASPANVVLDLVVCVMLVRWFGWHWAFLPSLVMELVPGLDLVPTWTAAVWIATGWGARGRRGG